MQNREPIFIYDFLCYTRGKLKSDENLFCQCRTSARGTVRKSDHATGIFKEPVEGRVKRRKLNLDGDKQADLIVHGGEDKTVYAYPKEHKEY